ncbi:hypothetical protein LJ737_02405 [Hymenobacter sp. 15J16-1T3B]|uniref:hypothetical protein n=1 Tax=Hymenobacter sp. 15J16-1T3B TaxID=2886941 RepID=UPI001D10FAEE|nr:hypothetical protein [Hymenobacter sp. 15J16-1T3B]MCC3156067.1 hypothetical protein [Hymenobacter sp. 15J16-1T3B]
MTTALTSAQLDRISQAARRGEYLYLDEPWLWLPIVPVDPPPAGSPSWFDGGLTRLVLEDVFSPVAVPLGALVLGVGMAYREVRGRWQQQQLPAQAPVRVEHNGYSPEAYYHDTAAFLWATPERKLMNRIQVGEWPADGVIVRGRPEQQRLVELLDAWYERGVPVREWVRGQRTFLLNPHMRYEEIQAFKRKYGVSLSD